MKNTSKKKLLIAVGALACVALIVVLAARSGTQPKSDAPPLDTENTDPATPVPVVNVPKPSKPTVDISLSTDSDVGTAEDPAAGADDIGTEQTIQSEPVKPEAPEPPEAPAGVVPTEPEHTGEDIPVEERNQETPPSYEETPTVTPPDTQSPAGSTNSEGQVYVPGFGYVDNGGANEGGTLDDMYENGNKIGSMGGD